MYTEHLRHCHFAAISGNSTSFDAQNCSSVDSMLLTAYYCLCMTFTLNHGVLRSHRNISQLSGAQILVLPGHSSLFINMKHLLTVSLVHADAHTH